MLVAALVVPYFIDWNAYRSTFEREAEKILGQPVHVVGTADASLIPMPSLTFTDVRVGGTVEQPMMRVERFAVRVELIPLITGAFKVVDMSILRPQVAITVGDDGSVDWLQRSEASKALDPDAVTLERVDIADGSISYLDTRSGRVVSLANINASVDARSLLGPWKADGGLVVEGTPTTFRLATGRRADDGTLRVKIEANPASAPVALSAEGDLRVDAKGIVWAGGFSLAKIAADAEGQDRAKPSGSNWRMSGSFDLRPAQLKLPTFTFSEGPEDRPHVLTGASTVDLGNEMRFDAVIKSRQIDLDRSVGKGPNEPANVGQATSALVAALSQLPMPPIPGRVGFDIPGIIVGGSLVQNLRFDATTSGGSDGWKIEEFGADFPGKTRLTADGIVRTAPGASFTGGVRLASQQPSIFAAWWRGGNRPTQQPLEPFDMSGQLSLAPGAIDITGIAARMNSSNIRGSLSWQRDATNGRRDFAVDVKADRFDYDQIASLTELFVGRSPTEPGGIAEGMSVKISAGTFVAGDTTLSNVSADGSYSNDVLVVRKFAIGDLAGAAVNATGRIENLVSAPNGQVSASLQAESLTGLGALVARLWPEAPAARWFVAAAPDLAPANLQTIISAHAAGRTTNTNMSLNGSLAGTALDIALGWNGTPSDWRAGVLKASARIENPDAGQALRQAGYATPALGSPGPFRLTVEPAAGGTLAEGVPLSASGEFAGLDYVLDGRFGFDASAVPMLHAKADLSGADLNPAFHLLLGALPGAEAARPLTLTAAVDVAGRRTAATFRDASIGGVHAGGSVELAPLGDRWRLTGTLDTDTADLAFATRLALGLADEPPDVTAGIWSKTTFGQPLIDGFDVDLQLNADKLAIADGLSVSNAALRALISGERTELSLASAGLAGGAASGTLSIVNSGGDASVSGQFSLKEAELSELAWHREGRSVAEGRLDLSGQIEGAGRSMAGVVSTLSGNGSLKIGAGTARFVNPQAFISVVRAADSGREMSDAELRKLFAGYLDAGTLAFRRVEGAFSIAAGTLRAQNLEVVTDGPTLVGGATVDINEANLDSQWSISVDPGDGKVAGIAPQVGLVFRGPIEAPARIVDVAPLVGYLQIRASELQNERYEKLAAEIREKEKLERLMRFQRDDAQRRAEAQKRAAEAAAKAEAERKAAEETRRRQEEKAAAEKAAADKAATAKAAADQAEADRRATDAAKKAAAARAEANRKALEAQKAADAAAEAEQRAADEAARNAAQAPLDLSPFLLEPPMPIPNPN